MSNKITGIPPISQQPGKAASTEARIEHGSVIDGQTLLPVPSDADHVNQHTETRQ